MDEKLTSVNVEPFAYACSLFNEVLRYGELKKSLGKVTHKMLSQQLKEMEADGLIYRKEYPQVPPKVEYGLTTLGISLMPILQQVCLWGQDHYTQR